MGETRQIHATAKPPGEALPCLKCGYDLRANAGNRCSECGWEIDRELLKGGWFPWERRRYRGRFITYVKTVWQVSGAIVAIVLAGLFLLIVRDVGLWRMVIQPQERSWARQAERPVWVENLGVPWSAGVSLLPVGPLMLAAFAFFAAQAPRRLFRAKRGDRPAAESAEAIACYATAPMAWLLPGMIFLLGRRDFRMPDWSRDLAPGILVLAGLVALVGV